MPAYPGCSAKRLLNGCGDVFSSVRGDVAVDSSATHQAGVHTEWKPHPVLRYQRVNEGIQRVIGAAGRLPPSETREARLHAPPLAPPMKRPRPSDWPS